jgi:hypothetical protein
MEKCGGIDMKTSNANVIVYVKKPVQYEMARVISKSIGALQGVVRAVNSPRSENMICVDYDPRTIGSQHILKVARDQGVPVRLIGM